MTLKALSRADLRILKTLQTDARLSNVELADRIGLSPSPCLRRVRALEESGLIDGYVARLNRRRLGLDVVAFVEVAVDHHTETAAQTFQSQVLALPEVVACYAMTGTFDYLLKVIVPSLDDYGEFTMKNLLRIGGIKDLRSSFVLQEVKESTVLPLDGLPPTGADD
jgi:Lrp/AsnC family leucine-responsive transcriptional regulator